MGHEPIPRSGLPCNRAVTNCATAQFVTHQNKPLKHHSSRRHRGSNTGKSRDLKLCERESVFYLKNREEGEVESESKGEDEVDR